MAVFEMDDMWAPLKAKPTNNNSGLTPSRRDTFVHTNNTT